MPRPTIEKPLQYNLIHLYYSFLYSSKRSFSGHTVHRFIPKTQKKTKKWNKTPTLCFQKFWFMWSSLLSRHLLGNKGSTKILICSQEWYKLTYYYLLILCVQQIHPAPSYLHMLLHAVSFASSVCCLYLLWQL